MSNTFTEQRAQVRPRKRDQAICTRSSNVISAPALRSTVAVFEHPVKHSSGSILMVSRSTRVHLYSRVFTFKVSELRHPCTFPTWFHIAYCIRADLISGFELPDRARVRVQVIKPSRLTFCWRTGDRCTNRSLAKWSSCHRCSSLRTFFE